MRRHALLTTTLGAVLVLSWTAVAGGSQPHDTYEAAVAADSPVAQYRFDDASGSATLVDSAGSNLAANSGITLEDEGPFGGSSAGLFGGEAYAVLDSNPLEGASEFTVEAWVYWDGSDLYGEPIVDLGSSATNHLYITPASTASAHEMLVGIQTSEGATAEVTAPGLSEKAWHDVAVTENASGELTLYIDGEEAGQATGVVATPASLGSSLTAYLGKSLSGAPDFEGRLSNVGFYARALSPAAIEAHYDAGEFPVNTAAPTVSGTARQGASVSAEAGIWTGLAPITFGYQWRRCNTAGAECANIGSATSSGYTATQEDVGSTLRVAVGASGFPVNV